MAEGVANSASHGHDHHHDHDHDDHQHALGDSHHPEDLGIINLDAFGVPIAVSASEALVPYLGAALPPGSTFREPRDGDNHFILQRRGHAGYRLSHGTESFPAGSDLKVALEVLAQRLRELIATEATDYTFVHAGAVGYNGRAIVLPGLSFSGKTTLVAELVKAGATYYSDEFAVLDADGRVHPYAKPLEIRMTLDYNQTPHDVSVLGGVQGVEPLPIGILAMCWYERGGAWEPRELSAGEAVLAVLGHTFVAKERPDQALPVVKRALASAITLDGTRGEASEAAADLLTRLG